MELIVGTIAMVLILLELAAVRVSRLATWRAVAQIALIELQRERSTAWIALYRALGGGWSERDLQLGRGPNDSPGPLAVRQ